MEVKLSVVIICRNSVDNLRELLPSLRDALAHIDSEIIITDNGSTDATKKFISASYPEVKYQRLGENRGVAYARNRGIERACGQYIWILDDDTIVNAIAADKMTEYLDTHAGCGIVACRLSDTEGNVQQSFKEYPGIWVKFQNLLGRNAKAQTLSEPISPCYVIGACQMIRREVFDQVGMLDENIFYGPEDADFCIRAAAKGWSVVYLPTVGIIHKWKRMTTRSPLSKMGLRHIRALLYFYCKHRRWF